MLDGRHSRLSTAPAELLGVLIREAARLTHGQQRNTAFSAKAAPLAVIGSTPRTLHVQASWEEEAPPVSCSTTRSARLHPGLDRVDYSVGNPGRTLGNASEDGRVRAGVDVK